MSAEEEEARRIAEMGKPILGEHSRLEVVIEESYEFKVNHRFIDFQVWMHSRSFTSELLMEKDYQRQRTIYHVSWELKPRLSQRPGLNYSSGQLQACIIQRLVPQTSQLPRLR